MSFARLAGALRLAERLNHAEQALELAFALAPSALKGDVYRRRAWLRLYQERLPGALLDSEKAVALTTGQDHALSLAVLGVTLDYSGDHSSALRRLREALAELDPDCERNYSGTLVSYGIVLAKGSDKDVRKGLEVCAELRSRLKKRYRMQRAKTWWLEGLLYERLGEPDKAWRSLDVARRSLIALGAAPEVAAVVADMARLSPRQPVVALICAEAAGVVAAAPPLVGPLSSLEGARRERIPRAAAALRDAASTLAFCPAL